LESGHALPGAVAFEVGAATTSTPPTDPFPAPWITLRTLVALSYEMRAPTYHLRRIPFLYV